jgi:hypothetical protein
MTFSVTFFLNGGLFDFDITFLAEAALFLILSLVVTFVFLNPITKQVDERIEFIDYTISKSLILLNFSYKQVTTCAEIFINEISELNRQVKLTKTYTTDNFQSEISILQKENGKLLSKLKGELAIKSAFTFGNVAKGLTTITTSFFQKKFQSNQ